ncbi:hypothetical protein CASFOL_027480 [Castilleja foliolosa]|uniref:Uncharacterized protein n=1 Tax=Castilleja foliolosa TaxID=1961234 RepID=A0ABD3CGJ5_9LAMI
MVRGAARGIAVPMNLSALWSSLQVLLQDMDGFSGVAVESSFFQSLFNGLVKEGEILGSLRAGVHWTPTVFAMAQKECVDSFFSQRGVATLKARALKEVWNVAATIPMEKGLSIGGGGNNNNSSSNSSGSYCEELVPEENFLAACNQEMLARGTELLKRTRKGDLHWKVVSVYIHRSGNVMLKMKSKHVASTITKKKKT